MPRVTRRSIASKESTTPESARSSSRGRGAKKEEPAEEDVAIGEPMDQPVKRGRPAAKGKAVETPPSQGRSGARGRSAARGKKQEPEEEEEEEDAEEEIEEKPRRGGARSKGKASSGGKTPPKGSRGSSRSARGKKQEEPEEEEEEEEEEADEVQAVGSGRKTPARGARSSGRSARGKKQEEPEEEEAEEEEAEVQAVSSGRKAPARGSRGSARSARGKKQEPEEEEAIEVQAAASERKTPARGSRASGRSVRDKAQEEEEEEDTTEVQAVGSGRKTSARGSGRSSRGKAQEEPEVEEAAKESPVDAKETRPKQATPPSRRERIVAAPAAVEQEVHESPKDASQSKELAPDTSIDEEIPEGRSRRTPTKVAASPVTPSRSGGRSSRGQVSEETSPKTTSPASLSPGKKLPASTEMQLEKEESVAEREEEMVMEQSKDVEPMEKEEEKVVEKKEQVVVKEDQVMERKEDAKIMEEEEEKMIEEEEQIVAKEDKVIEQEEVVEKEKEKVVEEEKEKAEDDVKLMETEEEVVKEEGAKKVVEERIVGEKMEEDEKVEEKSVLEKEAAKMAEPSAPSASEPMETETEAVTATQVAEPVAKQEEIEKRVSEESPSKKRKLEKDDGDDEEQEVKRARVLEVKPTQEDRVLEDYVLVDKNDVPPPDSAEVAASIALATPAKPKEPTTEPPVTETLAANIPMIVPLTEAELTKQYTNLHRDKDEVSSTAVEVGSEEAASDITGVSLRGLDTSDAVSMDSTSLEPPNDQPQRVPSNTSQVTNAEPLLASPSMPAPKAVAEVSAVPSARQNNSPLLPTPYCTSSNVTPNAAMVTGAFSSVTATVTATPSDAGQQGTRELASCIAPSPSEPNGQFAASQGPQNGTLQVSAPINASPLLTSTPNKAALSSHKDYQPSSPSITKRKFLPNPNFPPEMMDPAFCFSVVSYNILADCHVQRSKYATEPQYLDMKYRHSLLGKELDYLNGDVVCLQEVSPTYYSESLCPHMEMRGYKGHFIKRTKDFWDEGEAMFVKSSRFEIVSTVGISLRDLAFKEVENAGLSEEVARAAKKYLDRADVIQLSKLTCKKTGKTVTVCNIHVVFDLKAPDVQCVQLSSAIKELVTKAGNDLSPHIICGDFNSTVTSPGYQLTADGYLSDAHIHTLQAADTMDNMDGSSRSMVNHLWKAFQHTSSNLKSAYETSTGKESAVTTYNSLMHEGVDYIFYSSSSLDTVGVLEVVDQAVVDATQGLPTAHIPSDHLSLKSVFRFK